MSKSNRMCLFEIVGFCWFFIMSMHIPCPLMARSLPVNRKASFSTSSKPVKEVKSIPWAKGVFTSLLEQARKKRTRIFLDLYTDWCFPCERYEKEVFSRPHIAAFIEKNFFAVKREAYTGEGNFLRKRYNCVTFPCILILDQDGIEIERITKFKKAPYFLKELKDILNGRGTLASLLPKLKNNPKDSRLRFDVGSRLAYRGRSECVKHLRFVSKHASSRLVEDSLYILARVYYHSTLHDYKNAANVYEEYLRRFPKGKHIRQVKLRHHSCLSRMRRK